MSAPTMAEIRAAASRAILDSAALDDVFFHVVSNFESRLWAGDDFRRSERDGLDALEDERNKELYRQLRALVIDGLVEVGTAFAEAFPDAPRAVAEQNEAA